jgi:hypothetical protein
MVKLNDNHYQPHTHTLKNCLTHTTRNFATKIVINNL